MYACFILFICTLQFVGGMISCHVNYPFVLSCWASNSNGVGAVLSVT